MAELEDATSLAHYLHLKCEEKAETSSVPKEVAEEEDAVEDVFINDTDSISSSQVTSPKDPPKRTLAQMKAAQERKSKTYNSICSLKEAQLFYPTSKTTMHQTGVDSAHIGERSKMGGYKGYYVCAYGECDYATQTKAIVASHVQCCHLSIALGCLFCPTLAWWQARYWSDHMDSSHPDQEKFESVELPSDLQIEEVEPEVFVEQESFIAPSMGKEPSIKKDPTTAPPEKKRKTDKKVPADSSETAEDPVYYGPWPSHGTTRYHCPPAPEIKEEPDEDKEN